MIKKSLVIILLFILILSCNKKKDEIIKQYKDSFNKSAETKVENKILTNKSFIKEITALGSNFITFDLEKNSFNEDVRNITGLSDFIGYYEDKYLFTLSELVYNNSGEKNEEISKLFKDGIVIKEIDFNFEKSNILGIFKEKNWNNIKVKNSLMYFIDKNTVSIYNLETLKKVFNYSYENELLDVSFLNDIIVIQTESRNLIIKNINKSDSNLISVDDNVNSFYLYKEKMYYINTDNYLFQYDIATKKKESLNFQIPYTSKDKIVRPIELILFKDNKLFYVTHHYSWTMPFEIMHYYDLTEKKVVDLVQYIGLFTNYKIDFKS